MRNAAQRGESDRPNAPAQQLSRGGLTRSHREGAARRVPRCRGPVPAARNLRAPLNAASKSKPIRGPPPGPRGASNRAALGRPVCCPAPFSVGIEYTTFRHPPRARRRGVGRIDCLPIARGGSGPRMGLLFETAQTDATQRSNIRSRAAAPLGRYSGPQGTRCVVWVRGDAVGLRGARRARAGSGVLPGNRGVGAPGPRAPSGGLADGRRRTGVLRCSLAYSGAI